MPSAEWEARLKEAGGSKTVGSPDYAAMAALVETALDAERQRVWEEAAKIAFDWPADCLADPEENNCGPGIAEELRARAAEERKP